MYGLTAHTADLATYLHKNFNSLKICTGTVENLRTFGELQSSLTITNMFHAERCRVFAHSINNAKTESF